ncbi:hypothetical protein [Algoriphagus sp.]|uniref:hypothetical protein n=1 Tax=Algoriphagus sp. TaxID=1872435 RepID=UPI0026082AE7|nr:hypothetical protein [Algoriphagus sp.]
MIYHLLQSDGFWPLLLITVAGCYGWVIYCYFRKPLRVFFQNLGSANQRKTKEGILKVSWDDLVLAFALQRKLNQQPTSDLQPEEMALLNQFPFRELLAEAPKR